MFVKYLKYIGLIKDSNEESVSQEVFKPSTIKGVAIRYLDYLKELDKYQKDRQMTIENKNSQLVGQASIVILIFSLFVPLLMDKFADVELYITFSLSAIFLFVLLHYLLTILHAINTLEVNKYKYTTRKTSTVTKENRANTELDFINEEISDLVFSVNRNTPLDNKKGENLIFATRCFRIANIGFAILTFAVIISTFLIKKETQEITVKNLKELNFTFPDIINNRIINFPEVDSLTLKIDTSGNKLITK